MGVFASAIVPEIVDGFMLTALNTGSSVETLPGTFCQGVTELEGS